MQATEEPWKEHVNLGITSICQNAIRYSQVWAYRFGQDQDYLILNGISRGEFLDVCM